MSSSNIIYGRHACTNRCDIYKLNEDYTINFRVKFHMSQSTTVVILCLKSTNYCSLVIIWHDKMLIPNTLVSMNLRISTPLYISTDNSFALFSSIYPTCVSVKLIFFYFLIIFKDCKVMTDLDINIINQCQSMPLDEHSTRY